MKRLKLKCTPEKEPQHNPDPNTNDHIERFNKALENYCNSPKSKGIILHYKWYHTKDVWPPDINEDIIIYDREIFSIYRSFSVLQNLIYRTQVMKIKDQTEFYWMRIKTPSGKPQFES